MTKNKAFKFRIYPNEIQRELFSKTFGCVRLVYNHFLAIRKDSYEQEKKSISYNATAKELLQFKNEKDFLKEIDSICLQQSLRHLDTAFQNFFRDKSVGYPKFKSKKNHNYSYSTVCVNGNIKLVNGFLVLPKLKQVKIKQHRVIPEGYVLKSVTVSMTPTGKYFASILFEYDTEIKEILPVKIIGLDFSMHDLFASSELDIKADSEFLHCYRNALEKLAKEQRKLSHCMKGSNRYHKQRCSVSKIHEKVSNQRKDFLHKKSRQITNAYDLVCIESLDMKAMSRCLNFGKSVADNGWGMFTTFLEYKLAEQGKKLVKIDKWYPSSKTCHVCGYIKSDLQLSTREWKCPGCGTTHERDYNASINIKNEGLRIAFA